MSEGWFKLDRNIFENEVINNDCEHLAVWCFLLSAAAFKEHDCLFCGKAIKLKTGQLITSRRSIAKITKISESKVERILQHFVSGQLIEQLTTAKSRLITVLPMGSDEKSEPLNEPLANHCRTAGGPLPNTNNKEYKERMKYGTHKRARARTESEGESIFSSDASYDLEEFRKNAIGLRGYVPKNSS